ncbi:MAG: hypothetical protein ACR2NB_04730 [Solirubrobacteraceae bacterium]
MRRLPNLERALYDAAVRADTRNQPAPRRAGVRRWRLGTPLLAAVATLLGTGAAVAAVSGLLQLGDPVPATDTSRVPQPVAAAKGFTLTALRVPDPAGGPDWGIGLYDAKPPGLPQQALPSAAKSSTGKVTCVVVGRVQARQLGVVGRDGVFQNDGRFHPLSPAAQQSSQCGGRAQNGAFVSIGFGPPISASGYTGPVGTAIGGCRERVNLDGPTVSAQTRRRLRRVPQCTIAGLRRVIAGFAGPNATTATLTAGDRRHSLTLDPSQNGAYLFVVASATSRPPDLAIRTRSGTTCKPFSSPVPAAGTLTLSQAAKNCSDLTPAR